MDQLYDELQHFIRALDVFNQQMARNWDELQHTWDYTAELWRDDATQRRFENEWREMGDALKHYRQKEGEEYLQFLLHRKRSLDEYFGR